MSDITPSVLADEIETLIRATDGVTAVYPTAAISVVIVGEVLANTVLPIAAPALVSVDVGSDGTTVTALIGVANGIPAHETGRLVQTRIIDYLGRTRVQAADVTVRVGMIGS
ncbi:hypothetical protein [Leifsonia sp. A12D58]|uniref:hypothetical protein n=1 Tax=Leifsonia sp. A12D58 TaxID=3397674 RepID=UPI0039E02291